MTTTALHSPLVNDLATQVGPRVWRKQLLPVSSIDYKGRRLDFTHDYLAGLAASFKARAYDAVKFLLAPPDNSHTLDPERMRGTLTGVELADDGLYGLLDLSDEAAKLVTEHPDLGVSVRIVEDLQRADGKRFPAAIQHVLGTLDPRVTGMKPWQAVELANDTDVTVVDLTAAEYNTKEQRMTDTPVGAKIREALGLAADATDIEVQAKLASQGVIPPAVDATAPETAETGDLSDEELAQLLADAEAAANAVPAEATLSTEQQRALDLANAQAAEFKTRLATIEREAAEAKFESYAKDLVASGVPPADITLAREALLPEKSIDLSNSDDVRSQLTRQDAAIRKLLESRKGTVDLSTEAGTRLDGGPKDPAEGDNYWFPQFQTATTGQEG